MPCWGVVLLMLGVLNTLFLALLWWGSRPKQKLQRRFRQIYQLHRDGMLTSEQAQEQLLAELSRTMSVLRTQKRRNPKVAPK